MATVMTKPPGFFGSVSGAACTASSWSLASAGSMVTSGSSRQSSRPASVGRLRRLGLGQHRAREDMRDAVGVDGDQADRALALERAEPLLDARRRQAEAAVALRPRRRPGRRPARPRRARRDRELAAELLLVDRHEPAAAAGQRAEDAEHALLGAVDDLDDAAAMADRVALVADLLDAQQRAVADAGDFARPRLARRR